MKKILIEPLMRSEIDTPCGGVQVYCFSGKPKFILRIYSENEVSTYDENLNITEDIMNAREKNIKAPADRFVEQSFVLSKKLSAPFNFVRVDWMVFEGKLSDFSSLKSLSPLNKGVQNVNNTFERSDGFSVTSSSPPSEDSTLRKILFEELTFTPYSGFCVVRSLP